MPTLANYSTESTLQTKFLFYIFHIFLLCCYSWYHCCVMCISKFFSMCNLIYVSSHFLYFSHTFYICILHFVHRLEVFFYVRRLIRVSLLLLLLLSNFESSYNQVFDRYQMIWNILCHIFHVVFFVFPSIHPGIFIRGNDQVVTYWCCGAGPWRCQDQWAGEPGSRKYWTITLRLVWRVFNVCNSKKYQFLHSKYF